MNNPKITNDHLLNVTLSFLHNPDEDFKKFLMLLCENHRLGILSEIYILFQQILLTLYSYFFFILSLLYFKYIFSFNYIIKLIKKKLFITNSCFLISIL